MDLLYSFAWGLGIGFMMMLLGIGFKYIIRFCFGGSAHDEVKITWE